MKLKTRQRIKIIVSIYFFIGLFVGMIYGTTTETIRKIGTQVVKDKIYNVKNVIKNKDDLLICYSSKRPDGKLIDTWLLIDNNQILKNNGTYIKIEQKNSIINSCDLPPVQMDDSNKIIVEKIEEDLFGQIFNFFTPKKVDNVEKIFFTKDNDLVKKIGYSRKLKGFEEGVSLIIHPPNIEIKGDKFQILYLPFAIIIDIIAWPYRINQFFNSSHQTM